MAPSVAGAIFPKMLALSLSYAPDIADRASPGEVGLSRSKIQQFQPQLFTSSHGCNTVWFVQ